MAFDTDWCRHCGAKGVLTKEHIPPQVSGNKGKVTLYRQFGATFEVSADFEDGTWVSTLCEKCNTGASKRGLPQAYAKWREDVVHQLREVAAAFVGVSGNDPADLWSLERPGGTPFLIPMKHGDGTRITLQPGRIARQVLGMILAVQADPFLHAEYPQLAAAYTSKAAASIGPLSLHVALADMGTVIADQTIGLVTIDMQAGKATKPRGFWMLSCAPFLMILAEGNESPIAATRIDGWLQYPVKDTPATEQFAKGARKVTYPIAHRRDLLVAKLYGDQEALLAHLQSTSGTDSEKMDT
jgi:hypothetical protein